MSRAASLLALWAVACAPPEQGELAIVVGDAEAYATEVHPVLEASCATLDCHGDPDRPLRLFAETGLRASDDLRGLPITEQELEQNLRSLAAVDPGAPTVDESLVLLEPLAPEAGGVHHVGGDLWPSTTDPSYLCVRAHLAGQSTMPEARAACAAAWDDVGLPPE